MYRARVAFLSLTTMVNFCACFGCANCGDRNKDKSFHHLTAIVRHQGEKTRILTERRQRLWLAAIHQDDIKPESYHYARVCFVSGKPSLLYDDKNSDWVPTLNLGYDVVSCDPKRHEQAKLRGVKWKRLDQE